MKRLSLAVIVVIGSLVATRVIAEIIEPSPISGNFVLDISGNEQVLLVTPTGTTAVDLNLNGVGVTTADGNGNLSGNANLTFAIPPTSSPPGLAVGANDTNTITSASCEGTLVGTVAEPGNGTAQIQLQFTPPNAIPTFSAQDGCVPTTFTLSCVEIYPQGIAYPLVASGGNPGCAYLQGCPTSIAVDPTPTATPTPKKKRHRKADESVIPIEPLPYLSSANRLKCVATGVSSTAVSISGALISADLQQTAPASVTVPPPVTFSPVPQPPTAIPQATPGANG